MTFDLARHGGAAVITINRPDKRNALTLPQLGELAELVRQTASDAEVDGLVLTGNGAFCAGADLKTIVAKGKEGPDGIQDTIEEVPQQVIRALLDVPFPTVAALNGPAIGLGMDIALACDSRLISRTGWLLQGWGRVGLIPGTGGELLLHERNPWVLWRLLEQQRPIEPAVAEGWGLGEAIDADDAVPSALHRIEALAAMPASARATYVRLYRAGLKSRLDEHLAICAQAQVALLTDTRFESRVDRVVPAAP
jgi:enoyl-CoA hydratase/carnithine racemase